MGSPAKADRSPSELVSGPAYTGDQTIDGHPDNFTERTRVRSQGHIQMPGNPFSGRATVVKELAHIARKPTIGQMGNLSCWNWQRLADTASGEAPCH